MPVKWNATKQFDSKQFLLLNNKLNETWNRIQLAHLSLFLFSSRMLFVGLCLGEQYVLMLGCTCLREKCSKCVLNLSGTEYLKNLQPDWINAGNQSNYTESECLRKQWLPSSSHYLFSLSLCLIHHGELLTRRIHKDCILVCMLCILNSFLD